MDTQQTPPPPPQPPLHSGRTTKNRKALIIALVVMAGMGTAVMAGAGMVAIFMEDLSHDPPGGYVDDYRQMLIRDGQSLPQKMEEANRSGDPDRIEHVRAENELFKQETRDYLHDHGRKAPDEP